jgi:hypothetical protein
METLVVIILLCVAVILLGAIAPKPIGWVAIGFAVLAFLLAVLGGFSIHVGR